VTRVAEFLGQDGPLSRRLHAYEFRPGQLQMATAVETAFDLEQLLLCEAGTGTGKTLAYLVPAIQSGRKVIISTATRALQDQIIREDLPLIERTLGLSPRVAVMKGLSNYVCRRRLAGRLATGELGRSSSASLTVLNNWQTHCVTGDKSELSELSEDDPIWHEVTASSDLRVGASCPHYEDCFITRMRREAESAQLVIVNHHLFFADLALRGPHPGRVLPNYDAIVFDEAHQLESIAVDFFGVRVTSTRLERLGHDVARTLQGLRNVSPDLWRSAASAIERLEKVSKDYFSAMLAVAKGQEGRGAIPLDDLRGEPQQAWIRLDTELESLDNILELTSVRLPELRAQRSGFDSRSASAELELGSRRIAELRLHLSTIAESPAERVLWTEKTERQTTISSSPIDLSETLRTRLFDQIPAIVLTSATLTTSKREAGQLVENSFQYLRSRLGLVELPTPVIELVVPSPFDYRNRSLLYTPKDLPAPADPNFVKSAASRIAELVKVTQGGAFVLTTSLRSMHALYRELEEHLPDYVRLLQGQAPKSDLIARFRREERAVLVATVSFWEGVDVPGRALRLVILEKIPFLVPSDPLVSARAEAIEEAGGNPFMEYFIPAAAIALKQGFGRLIRSREDAGIVALLDDRVHRRGYGQRLLSSLPPARRTDSLATVARFWSELDGTVPKRG
jgi:ATP-dependent DNA helicase DinG